MRVNLKGLTLCALIISMFMVIFSILVNPGKAEAYPRKILAEIFTNTSCPLCGSYIPPVERTLEDNFSGSYTFITYHTWWPNIYDPWYFEYYERLFPDDDEIRDRIYYFGYDDRMGVPSYFFDGTRIRWYNPVNDFVNDVDELVEDRLDSESPFLIELDAQVDDQDLLTTIYVSSDENVADVNLIVALCEIFVEYDAPSGQTEFQGNVLDMVPSAYGQNFSIPEGRTIRFDFESTLDIGWRENDINDLKLVAWIETEDHEVLQAEEYLFNQDSPDILIIDASDSELAGALIEELFGNGALPNAHRWIKQQNGEFSEELLQGYQTVLYHSFNNDENLLTQGEESALLGYLDDGGTLIVSSPGLGIEHGNGLLFQRYLGVMMGDDLDCDLVCCTSDDPDFSGARIFLEGEGGAGVPFITPDLNAHRDAVALLDYFRDGENVGTAGVIHETETYRTLTLSFPIESISGYGGTESREEFARRIWAWVDRQVSVPGENTVPASQFSLDPAYPNPFNSVLTIPFNLNHPGEISIELLDLAGRHISLASRQQYGVGKHTITFDAESARLANGLYLILFQYGEQRRLQRAVYLR